jgi:cytidylate kinase
MFLTASVEARAGRRSAEVSATAPAEAIGLDRTREELARRDRLDSTRAVAPLYRARDAVELDTTGLDQEQAVAAVLAQVRRVLPEPVSGDLAH